jgi:hypothetical protein
MSKNIMTNNINKVVVGNNKEKEITLIKKKYEVTGKVKPLDKGIVKTLNIFRTHTTSNKNPQKNFFENRTDKITNKKETKNKESHIREILNISTKYNIKNSFGKDTNYLGFNKENEKVAIIFRGLAYVGKYLHPHTKKTTIIDYKTSLENYKKYLFENNNYEIFFHTYNSKELNKNEMINILKPKKFSFSDPIYDINTQNIFEKTKGLINSFKLAIDNYKEYIKETNSNYDYIIITRFDLFFKIKFSDLPLDKSKFMVSLLCKDTSLCDDNFFVMNHNDLLMFREILEIYDKENNFMLHNIYSYLKIAYKNRLKILIDGRYNIIEGTPLFDIARNLYNERFNKPIQYKDIETNKFDESKKIFNDTEKENNDEYYEPVNAIDIINKIQRNLIGNHKINSENKLPNIESECSINDNKLYESQNSIKNNNNLENKLSESQNSIKNNNAKLNANKNDLENKLFEPQNSIKKNNIKFNADKNNLENKLSESQKLNLNDSDLSVSELSNHTSDNDKHFSKYLESDKHSISNNVIINKKLSDICEIINDKKSSINRKIRRKINQIINSDIDNLNSDKNELMSEKLFNQSKEFYANDKLVEKKSKESGTTDILTELEINNKIIDIKETNKEIDDHEINGKIDKEINFNNKNEINEKIDKEINCSDQNEITDNEELDDFSDTNYQIVLYENNI